MWTAGSLLLRRKIWWNKLRQVCAHPGVLSGKQKLPFTVTHSEEINGIDVHPTHARGFFGFPCDVGAVIYAVEIDWFAVVILPLAACRRFQASHGGQRRPHTH